MLPRDLIVLHVKWFEMDSTDSAVQSSIGFSLCKSSTEIALATSDICSVALEYGAYAGSTDASEQLTEIRAQICHDNVGVEDSGSVFAAS